MINDFFIILYWWFILFGLGIIFLPLTWLFFRKFFDLGYPLSKIIAILFLSYFVWLLGSLHISSFNVLIIWFLILIFISWNIILAKKNESQLKSSLRNFWKIIFFEEYLFLTILIFWSFVRGFQPNIEGLEKFMDFGFINSILRANFFPPLDMWMAGKTINYYYFGHLITAVLTKMSGLSSSITYNLMIATIVAFTFVTSFSLGGNIFFYWLKKNEIKNLKLVLIVGFLSALLLTFGGNLHTIWWILTNNFNFNNYWYPNATRFIVQQFGAKDNTIHEFPIYSFIVSDLHAHVNDIPLVLLFLSFLFSFLIKTDKKNTVVLGSIFLFALIFAVMYMTNSWDFFIYFLVFGITIFWFNYPFYQFNPGNTNKQGFNFKGRIKNLTFTLLIVLFLFILFSLPFHLNFSQIAKGIGLVHANSPIWQLLILWGYQWLVIGSFLIFLIIKKFQAIFSSDRQRSYTLQISDSFILILIIVATFLIIIPEIFYIKDIYIASFHRANTMFKLVYQSFIMYSFASGYIVFRVCIELKRKWLKFLFSIFYFLIFVVVLIYPYFGIKSYYNNLKDYQGLYGISFLKKYPDDYQAIIWLNENISDQPVILEAVGDSYTDFNRVSTITGLPTVQGWLVHEWLWRGSFDEVGKRAFEVQIIYETEDKNQTLDLIKKYKIQYVFIGEKEREKYKLSEEKFGELGEVIFQSNNTKIYKIQLTN